MSEWTTMEIEEDPDWFEIQTDQNGKTVRIWKDPYGMKVSVTDYPNGELRRRVKRLSCLGMNSMKIEAIEFADEESK